MSAPTAQYILARYRLRAQRWALWMEAQWASGRTSANQGLVITPGEVSRILQPPEQSAGETAAFLRRPEIATLAAPIAAADAALAEDVGWIQLCDRFAIPDADRDLLALALAEALDPEFGRVLAYLHDDTRQSKATPWLAATLSERAMRSTGETLLRWRLVTTVEPQAALLPATAVQADEAVLTTVLTGDWADRKLLGIAALHDEPAEAELPVLHPSALQQMLTAANHPSVLAIDVLGAEGVGRRVLAAQFAAISNRRLLIADGKALTASSVSNADLIVAVLRMARAMGATILWRHAEQLTADAISGNLVTGLDMIRALPPDAITRPEATGIVLDKPALATRLTVWRHFSDAPPPPVVTTQRLTPGEIALVAHAAPGGDAAIRLALRRTTPPENDVLSRLPCPYVWDDLVVPGELHTQLREFQAQIRLRWEVYENWGFAKLTHLGTGISALFAGPSGTGKTMAAQILAGALDLDLYRIDLAGVVNKYIGETEKRLRDVFAFGERAGVVLFFDEADALFGSRMQIKDSHDRFANIEIDYLLQRIERFDGIAILATNRKSDLDTAFVRRLRFVVDFMPPGPEERLEIWRRALPAQTPAGEPLLDDIDWQMLAGQLQLNGAEIKSSALSAAFRARDEESRIRMRHVLAAAQRELAKRGQVLRLRPTAATGT